MLIKSSWLRHRGQILQALLLAAIWLNFSVKLYPIYLLWGVISIIFVIWLSNRLHHVPLAENDP